MRIFTALLATELRLVRRDPALTLLSVLLPTGLLTVFGSIPALREPTGELGGQSFVEVWTPSMVVIALATLALQSTPAYVATYRERGVLRRLSATPVSPGLLLGAHLATHLLLAVLSVLLLIVVAAVAFGVPLPAHPLGFALAFSLGAAAIFGLGLVVAAVTPSARAAGGIALPVFFAAMFFGGVYFPTEYLPDLVARISVFVPPGVEMLQDAWTGSGPRVAQLAVMAALAAIVGGAAARAFRWD